MAERSIGKDEFLMQHTEFLLREQVEYPNGGRSRFYDNGVDMVIIDDGICDHDGETPVFSYMLLTDKQNHYMHEFRRVFRFLGYEKEKINQYLKQRKIEFPTEYASSVSDRSEQAEVSPLEHQFETNFSNVYGMNALRYLSREYEICDEEGKYFFLDYLVNTSNGKYAVEENGVTYHHPQIIGAERYQN